MNSHLCLSLHACAFPYAYRQMKMAAMTTALKKAKKMIDKANAKAAKAVGGGEDAAAPPVPPGSEGAVAPGPPPPPPGGESEKDGEGDPYLQEQLAASKAETAALAKEVI